MSRQRAELELSIEKEKKDRIQLILDSLLVPSSPLDDTVDKVLVTNLFVAYFHTNK